MKLPGLSLLKDKWVWIGLAAGAGVYLFTNKHGYSRGPDWNMNDTDQFMPGGGHPANMGPRGGGGRNGPGGYSLVDRPGLYEVPNKGFENLRFSGQAELQRRLTVT